jgi:hypothetical protein
MQPGAPVTGDVTQQEPSGLSLTRFPRAWGSAARSQPPQSPDSRLPQHQENMFQCFEVK